MSMDAARWSVDRERLSLWVPEGERMTVGCAVTYGRALWVRVLRHRGNDLRYAVRGIWFEMMRGEAEAVGGNPRVRVEFDKGQEVELRRYDGGVEHLLISRWDAVHAEALYAAFPPRGDDPR